MGNGNTKEFEHNLLIYDLMRYPDGGRREQHVNRNTLNQVGNLSKPVPIRKIYPRGLLGELPGLILKEYIMKEGDKNHFIETINVSYMLNEQIEKGRLNPHSGLGFLILSDGILNVSTWDSEYPDVIIPQIYVLDGPYWIPKTIEQIGAFCSGEKRVYDHENQAWLRFLNTQKTEQDKLTYLKDFLIEE